MSATSLSASADLCGRRIVLRWTVFPDALGGMPRTTLCRKEHDFEYPTNVAPYLVYDSAAFPPTPVAGVVAVHNLPSTVRTIDGLRCTEETCTVAHPDGNRTREVLRRTVRTFTRPDRAVVRQEIELLDAGADAGPLEPGRTYYYQLDIPTTPSNRLRATATAAGVYRYNYALYEAIPAIYRLRDTAERPADAGTGWLPEASAAGGQLRRLIDVFGTAVGALRSGADGLRNLRDIAETDACFLPLLAQWIGWELSGDNIARARNEIAAAPSRYRTIGTVAGIAEIVAHYTGWTTRISETAQNITLTNNPPQRNLFAAVERSAGHFSGALDAAVVLGLSGAAGQEVTGTLGEPFPLADGMTLRLAIDGAAPVLVRFTAGGLANIGAASAADVAAAIARSTRSLDTSSAGGKLRLRSTRTTPEARVEVLAAPASLVSLDGAPGGRLSTATDAAGAGWVAYATTAGADAPVPRLRIGARMGGQWYDSQPIGDEHEPAADPALVALAGGRLWCAWVSAPTTSHARLRYRIGTVADRTPARLHGALTEPFALVPGSRLTLSGTFAAQTFTVQAGDYANVAAARATEVVTAMNHQLTEVKALPTSDGGLVLVSVATGPAVTMRVDLAASTAAWALGFGDRELVGRGGWNPHVDWGQAVDVVPALLGRNADCAALAEPDGGVRLCWSMHDSGMWRLVTTRWTGKVLASTATGLNIVAAGSVSTITAANGLPSDNIRDAVADTSGTVWLATAAGAAARTSGGAVTAHTAASTAGGLVNNDVRAVAVGPDETVWFATAAGVSRRGPGGVWTSFGTANGLPANDIRSIAVSVQGTVWAATPVGIGVLRGNRWQSVTAADGLASPDVRRFAIASDRSVWVATAAGITRIAGKEITSFDLADLGPGAANVRDLVADGTTMWLATAAGVVEFRNPHDRTLHAAAAGIADPDCRAITLTGGEIWVGTASEVLGRGVDGRWTTRSAGPGTVVGLSGDWSAPALIDNPGAGERDPHLIPDGTAVLLAAARRTRSAAGDTWQLTLRRRNAGATAWTDATELTAAGAIDREPTITGGSGSPLRVYFRSNRNGGARIWRLEVTATGVASAPVAVTAGSGSDTDPAVFPNEAPPLLLFRSDRNVAPASLWDVPQVPVPQEISVRRYAGSGTVTLGDGTRNTGAGAFGDLLDYTPQRPLGDAPEPDERYTPGTVALHVDQGHAGAPIDPTDAQRLRRLLIDFVPANVRVVAIASP